VAGSRQLTCDASGFGSATSLIRTGTLERKACLHICRGLPPTRHRIVPHYHDDQQHRSLNVAAADRRYELFIDDLPVWGFVGPPPEETKDDENIYIYTHKAFDVNYNENRVRRSRGTPVRAVAATNPAGMQRHASPYRCSKRLVGTSA